MPLKERVDKEWSFQDQLEINDFFIGHRLGGGLSREVFEYWLLPDKYVIKIEAGNDGNHFQNIREWDLWHAVKGTKWEKFFAPCVRISYRGVVLIQERTTILTDKVPLPEFVPEFVTDARKCNWGMYKCRPVLHDYGFTLCNKKMVETAIPVKRTEMDSSVV